MTRAAGAAAIAGAFAAFVVAIVVSPFGPTTTDPDASASVLYFERLAAGRRLEAFVPTTPKPLLTLLYGVAWNLARDWRVLTWLAIAVFGVAVAVVALFVWRASLVVDAPSDDEDFEAVTAGAGDMPGAGLRVRSGRSASAAAGAFAGAVFVAVALATWSDLVLEVSRANSIVGSIACWAGAGVALVGPRRQPWIAGVALLLGGLLRFETLGILLGIVAVAALVGVAEAVMGRRLVPSRMRWRRREVAIVVGLGLLSILIACLHDGLLTGDPFYWTGVPARYTALYAPAVAPMPVLSYAETLIARLAGQWPLVALAVIGLGALAARRLLVPLVGLGSLVVGMTVLLFGLAVRGVYISNRYYEPLDFALLGLAAFGIGGLVELAAGVLLDLARPDRLLASLGRLGATLVLAAALALSVVVGAGIMGRPAPWDPTVAATLAPARAASANLDANLGRLAPLAPPSSQGRGAGAPAGAPRADPRSIRLYVPSTLRSRVVVVTGASLTAVGDTLAAFVSRPAWDGLRSGQWIYHDPAVDRPIALTRALDADPPDLAGATAQRIWRDASTGVRLLRIETSR